MICAYLLSWSHGLIISRWSRSPESLPRNTVHHVTFRWDWSHCLSLDHIRSLNYQRWKLRLITTFRKLACNEITSRLLISKELFRCISLLYHFPLLRWLSLTLFVAIFFLSSLSFCTKDWIIASSAAIFQPRSNHWSPCPFVVYTRSLTLIHSCLQHINLRFLLLIHDERILYFDRFETFPLLVYLRTELILLISFPCMMKHLLKNFGILYWVLRPRWSFAHELMTCSVRIKVWR